jgi:hypothetical protein
MMDAVNNLAASDMAGRGIGTTDESGERAAVTVEAELAEKR